jgi:diacylglycerol O-acyltransferase
MSGLVRTVRGREPGAGMPAPFTAPRTSWNVAVSARRTVAMSRVSLDDIKTVKKAFGTTVNDVVLAVASGALRRFLEGKGELPDKSLIAVVPVSVRTDEEKEATGGANKVSALFTSLASDIEDPVERLMAIHEVNKGAKEEHKAIGATFLQDWAEFAAPTTFALAARAYSGLKLADRHPVVHNLVISNVPGPPLPLYFMGARIEALHPLGPVFHGAGLNITVMSNNGRVGVGVIACRESMPDVDDLAQRFPAELERLREAVQASGATTPITKAKGRAKGKAKA